LNRGKPVSIVAAEAAVVYRGWERRGQPDCVTTPKMSSRGAQRRSDLNLWAEYVILQRFEIASSPSLRSGSSQWQKVV